MRLRPWIALLGLLGTTLSAAAPVAAAEVSPIAPSLEFTNPNSQALFGTAYATALKNLLEINTVPYDAEHSKSGLMDPSVGMVRAGGGYAQPWTRDASINSWNATSLLSPGLAKNTLWAVVDKDAAGNLRVQQDNQQWDQVVWATAAWNHYLVTGDQDFLENAYRTTSTTLAIREQATVYGFNSGFGLFTGPSFFNDGVAGFPAPPADANESFGSGSRSYAGIASGMYLSTNALYYSAYVSAANMAEKLRRPPAEIATYRDQAAALKKAINKQFWNRDAGTYDYQLLADGAHGAYQEGTGLAFVLLFGIADQAQARSVIAKAEEMTWGMPDTFPHWDRYSAEQPGRHNAIVWPLVQGLWAKALAKTGAEQEFAKETALLAKLANNNGGFWEIYNGDTGVIDGGYQIRNGVVKNHWNSQPNQTWSATGFIDMIHTGLFGLTFGERELSFAPTLPVGWGEVTLRGVRYRNADLTITLRGSGRNIRSFTVDGWHVRGNSVASSLRGKHTVEISLTGDDGRGHGSPGHGDGHRAGHAGSGAGDRDADLVPDARDNCADTAGTAALGGCPDPKLTEAEDATNSGGVKTNGNHSGFSGRAFVDGFKATGATSTYTVHRRAAAPERVSVTVKYANANNNARTLTLKVDGTTVRQVSLPIVSKSWDDWGSATIDDVPISGQAPAVSLVYEPGDSGGINLDALEIGTKTVQSCDAAAAGFTPVLQLELPEQGGFLNKELPYSLDRRTEVGTNFDRVGYCLQLDGPNGAQWVWTAMEPFSPDASRIGLPTKAGEVVRQRVDDLDVWSNVPGVTGGTGQAGYLEMWPNSYAAGASTQVVNSSSTAFDADDSPTAALNYGSFQVSQIGATRASGVPPKTVFAVNSFIQPGTALSVGIGTSPTTQPDWTFTNNAAQYTQRKLTAYVRTSAVALSEAPQDLQLIPRDSRNGANVPVAGRITDSRVQQVELSVTSNGKTQKYTSRSRAFRFTPRINAALQEYSFVLRASGRDFDRVVARRTGVVSGDVYVVEGQSNAEAAKRNGAANAEESPYLRSYGSSTSDAPLSQADRSWNYATGDVTVQSGSVGQWAIRTGRRIVDTYKVPVAIIQGAHGGRPISFFQRNDAEPDDITTNYGRLRQRLAAAGVIDDVRAVLWYQGEQDKDDAAVHVAGFRTLLADWRAEIGTAATRYYVYQVRTSPCSDSTTIKLREAQRRLGDTDGVTVLSTNGLSGHDGCHYAYAGGYREMGDHTFAVLARDLYGGPSAGVAPPNPSTVTAAGSQLVVNLRSDDVLTVDNGAAADFRVEGAPVTVTSVTQTGAKLLLDLSGPATAATALTYLGHLRAGPWITNATGAGLLSFSLPINR